jgi:hypothetical protein
MSSPVWPATSLKLISLQPGKSHGTGDCVRKAIRSTLQHGKQQNTDTPGSRGTSHLIKQILYPSIQKEYQLEPEPGHTYSETKTPQPEVIRNQNIASANMNIMINSFMRIKGQT